MQRGDPFGADATESARLLRSEQDWVEMPEVAQHGHVVVVLDVHRGLMDLGAHLPACDVLQRHGYLEEADLVAGLG
jgi:hypothetical protein